MAGAVCIAMMMATVFQTTFDLSYAKTVTSDKATTIRLAKTEGSVSVINSSKEERSQSEDMRLYNGDHQLTDITSYAWMSLDDTKLIKLDEESESEVRKKGKKLEVLLDSGSLFFNVTKPLEDDENLNIRTSTMVTGIRGTCGWVRILDGLTTRIYLLEGRLDCIVTNPVEGSTKTITLKGGQYADFCVYEPDRKGDKCDILIEKFTREDIEPYVLIELAGDDATIDKIYKDSGIDLRDLTREEAENKLKDRQKKTLDEKNARDGKLADQERNISKDPVWVREADDKDEVADVEGLDTENGTDGDNSGSEAGKNDKLQNNTPDNNTVQDNSGSQNDSQGGKQDNKQDDKQDDKQSDTEDSVIYLQMPQTATTVQGYLDKEKVQKVVLMPGSGSAADNTLSVDIPFTVPASKTLEARSGVPVNVIAADSMTVNGTADLGDGLTNNGTVNVNSANTLKVADVFVNAGTLNNTSTGRIVLSRGLLSTGNITTSGKIESETGKNIQNLIILNGGSFTITGGSIKSGSCDTLIKLGKNAAVEMTLKGGVISNEKRGGEALNVVEGTFNLKSLGTDINGVSDSLLGSNVDYAKYGAASVWRTDERYHLVLLSEVESYQAAVVSNIEHGTLEVPARVEVGATVTIIAHPDDGYELASLTVNLYDEKTKRTGDPVSLTSDNKFTMPKSNVIVGGSFKESSVSTVTISFYAEDGRTLLYSTKLAKGKVPVFEGTTPAKSNDAMYTYTFAGWTNGGNTYASNAIPAANTDASYIAKFDATPVPYSVNISGSLRNGTVTAEGTAAGYGTTVTLTVTPNTSYKLKTGSVAVTTASGTALSIAVGSSGKYTFTMPAEPVSVTAEFEYDGAYRLAATWCEDNGNVKFRIGSEYVTCANPGDVVIMETTPLSGYGPSLSPTDNYDLKLGPAVTVFYNATEDVWYFDMPSRDVTDLDVIFTNAGTDSYQIRENYLPAGTNYSLSLRASAQQNTVPADHYSPGSKISIDVPATQDVKNLSVTCGGNAVRVYETGGRKYFYMPRGNVTVSATFEPKTYSITYDLNAGGDSTARINGTIPTTGTYGTTVSLPANVTRSGYRFIGWYEYENPGQYDVRLTEVPSDNCYDMTLYAIWGTATTLSLPQEPEDIQNKLNDLAVSEVILAPGSASNTFTLGEQITIPAGKTLTISEGVTVIVNEDGSILNLSGNTLNNSGIFYIGRENGIVNGDEDNPGRIVNDGYIFLNSSRAIDTSYGNIVNNRTIYYKTGSTIKYSNNNGSAPEGGIQVLDMGLAGDAIYIRTRIDQTSNYKLDFFGNGEIGENGNESQNAAYINGNEKTSITELEIHEGITKVGNNAFNIHLTGYNEYYGFTSVTLPDTLKQIGNYAFYNLIRPETITIPDSVTTIGNFAFARQQDKEDHTTSINLPASLASLGEYAFAYRNRITSVEIPGSVSGIGVEAFSNCTSLASVVFNEGVETIGTKAFYNCSNLNSITFSSTVREIGESAFERCSLHASLSIPSSVTYIGNRAFASCSGLEQIAFPNSVTTMGNEVVAGCSSLTNITWPEGITTFDLSNYSNTGFASIVIPDSVTSIQGQLNGVSKLTTITIGKNITQVGGSSAFYSTPQKLTTIIFKGTMEEWNTDNYKYFRPHQDSYGAWINYFLIDPRHIKVICTDGEIQY